MAKLGIGDRVQIIHHRDEEYVGKIGKIVHVGSGNRPVTQPSEVDLPTLPQEPYYAIELDDGVEMQNLKD